jgi:hypothetical protein
MFVDLEGLEPLVQQLILGHAKILVAERHDDRSKRSI